VLIEDRRDFQRTIGAYCYRLPVGWSEQR
jgi:hypothetical protein